MLETRLHSWPWGDLERGESRECGGTILRHLSFRFVKTMQSDVQKPAAVNHIWRSCGESARVDRHEWKGFQHTRPDRDVTKVSKVSQGFIYALMPQDAGRPVL